MANINYNQRSFSGGMNLLLDDSSLNVDQYKTGFNLRNRYSRLDPVFSSVEDTNAPSGLKQECLTFGKFIILFVAGKAYYRYYTATAWSPIANFSMSKTAPRYWTKAIPVSTTNYSRFAVDNVTINDVQRFSTATSAFGQNPGLVVQDNINQPWFIFINSMGQPEARQTKTYADWSVEYDDGGQIVGTDNREYVPIGNCMEFVDGVLYIVSPDKGLILRSVSGRPLDFVIAVNVDGSKAGDAYTTAYSVGVPNISCIRALADNSLFVSASGSNFSVAKDKSNVAVKEWGEFTYERKPLFNAVCLSDRTIFDSVGDTRFISISGIRSFNAIMQEQNEGRNSVFSANINQAFVGDRATWLQVDGYAAGILFDEYELYAINTVYGDVIAVYDTILNCWVGFDLDQTDSKPIKQFAKIELDNQALFAITADDRFFTLYSSPTSQDVARLRTTGISSDNIPAEQNVNVNICGSELKPTSFRLILNNITQNGTITLTPYVDNYKVAEAALTKPFTYTLPTYQDDVVIFPDTDTQLGNYVFPLPDCKQGWRCFFVVSWTNGSLLKYSVSATPLNPQNPISSR